MFDFKIQPYDYQLSVFNRFRDDDYFGLFCDMGTGKTKMDIDIASWQFFKGKIELLIVIAPKNVYLNWLYEELPKHMSVDYEADYYESGLGAKAKARLNSFYSRKSKGVLKVFLINIEALRSDLGFRVVKSFSTKFKTKIVVDESTAIKSPKSIQGKRVRQLTPHSVTRSILTGYPSPNGLLDYYGQIEFLQKGISGHKSYFFFESYYAIKAQRKTIAGRTFNVVIGYQNEEKLMNLLSSFSVRLKKEDCLDLPERIEKNQYIDMTPKQKSMYQEFRRNSLLEMDAGDVSTTEAAGKLMKLRQIATGIVKDDEGKWHRISEAKLDALKQTLDQIGDRKVIIWAVFIKDIEDIKEMLGDSAVTFYGGNKDNMESVKIWKTDPSVKYLVINPMSGSMGLTLTESSYNIYYSYNYKLDDMLQSKDRTHRIGQTEKVTYIYFVTKGTVEPKIKDALHEKKCISDRTLDGLRHLFLE